MGEGIGPAGRAHSAWGGHFVTCVPLWLALPLVAIKNIFVPTIGRPGRSRYTPHEVGAAA